MTLQTADTYNLLPQLRQLQADLAEFEQRYGLTSAEFYRRYQAGQTDDRMNYVEWASLIQMADNLREPESRSTLSLPDSQSGR